MKSNVTDNKGAEAKVSHNIVVTLYSICALRFKLLSGLVQDLIQDKQEQACSLISSPSYFLNPVNNNKKAIIKATTHSQYMN